MISKRTMLILCSLLDLSTTSVNADAPGKLKSFKGWELYSWKSAQGWHFSLLTGTNRNKSCDEVKNDKATKSLAQLEENLNQLEWGEWVTWSSGSKAHLIDKCELAMPPRDIVKQIQEHCNKSGLHLHVPDEE
jgi:hypothetical protein